MVNLSTYNLQKGQSTAMINVEVPVYVSSHIYAVTSACFPARMLVDKPYGTAHYHL
jgi:hypothetical protein